MSEIGRNSGLLKALEELQQYLSDVLPPLMVADSIELLLKYPPSAAASGIQAWISGLSRRDPSVPLSDFLYHAILKIHLMQEYKLVPAEEFEPFLKGLKEAVLNFCPPSERAFLKQSLNALGTVAATGAVPQLSIMRQGSTQQQAPDAAETRDKKAGFFTNLMKRLERHLGPAPSGGAPAGPQREQVITETLAEAARTAKETSELNRVLENMRQMGVQTGPDEVFRALGQTLPGWSIPTRPDIQLPESSNLQAMHRIISKSADTAEAANHFRHLIKAAVDRFNQGFLPQAAAMFNLASKIIQDKEVDAKVVELVLIKGHDNLNEEKLRTYAENPAQHSLLVKVLNFFPAYALPGLMQSLYDCPRRERRKLLLLLLESHGDAARSACLEYLRKPMDRNAPEIEVWYRRNLIYMLRRIPMPATESLEQTVDAVLPYSDLRLIPMIVKETLALLPQLKHDKVERGLRRMLQQLESMPPKPAPGELQPEEVRLLLDRVVSALSRLGTQNARRAILDHALKKKPENDALARLAELGHIDLSEDEETLDRLTEAHRANLPLKMLGIGLPQKDFVAKCIVQALAGTPHEESRAALEELASRYPEFESGQAAAKVLAKQDQAKTARPVDSGAGSLMGDLEVFGLPALLQSLADNGVTGNLTLKNQEGKAFATVSLIKGRLQSCRFGMLQSEAAFYQMFEKPQPGTFQFVRALEPASGSEAKFPEVLPLMLEGLRRFDEVQHMRAVVPDEMRLRVKSLKPSQLPAERDGLLFRDLWTAVQNGATALECEAAVVMDCYRVRRLLAHWLESGVIETS